MTELKQMDITVSFPGLNKKPKPVQSLVNFLMEDSSIFFRKNATKYEIQEALQNSTYVEKIILDGDIIDNTVVRVSGTLDLESDISGAPEELSPIVFDHEEYVVSDNCIYIETPFNTNYYTGWYNLAIELKELTIYSQEEILQLAQKQSVQPLEYSYEYIEELDRPGYHSISLRSPITDTVYLSGYINTNNQYSAMLLNKAIEVDNGMAWVLVSSDLPIGDGWDSLIITQSTITFPPEATDTISGNIRFNLSAIGMTSGTCYDALIVYSDDKNSKFIPVNKSNFNLPTTESELISPPMTVSVSQYYEPTGQVKLVISREYNELEDYTLYTYSVYEDDSLVIDFSTTNEHMSADDINYLESSKDGPSFYRFLECSGTNNKDFFLFNFDENNQIVIKLQSVSTLEMINGVAKSNTVLIPANTNLSLKRVLINSNNEQSDIRSLVYDIDDFIKIPVKIIPKIDGVINYNEGCKANVFGDPLEEPLGNSNIYITNNGTAVIPIVSHGDNIDFQLRTSTMSAVYRNDTAEDQSLAYIIKDVYYKVGFCPSDCKDSSLNELSKTMINQCLIFKNNEIGCTFATNSAPWANKVYKMCDKPHGKYYRPIVIMNYNWITEAPDRLPERMYAPVIDSINNSTLGIIYFRLYNSDGTLFNKGDVSEYTFLGAGAKRSEDDDYPDSNGGLALFTDNNMHGGFIKSLTFEEVHNKLDEDWDW